jgi:hypothetical protein
MQLGEETLEGVGLGRGEKGAHLRVGRVGDRLELSEALPSARGESDVNDATVTRVALAHDERARLETIEMVGQGRAAQVHAVGEFPVGEMRLVGEGPEQDPLLKRSTSLGQLLVELLTDELHGEKQLPREAVHRKIIEIEQFDHESPVTVLLRGLGSSET